MKINLSVSGLNSRLKEHVPAVRGIWPALIFSAAALVMMRALEYWGIGTEIVWALKRRFFVFTQEPALTWQVMVFLQTFVLKLGLSLFIIFYLMLVRQNPLTSLGLNRSAAVDRRVCGIFFIFSAGVGIFSGLDPLTPAFPMHSFFGEALVWGNIAAVFSMVVVAPIAEEIFFRGFLYPAFGQALGAVGSVLAVSVLFAAAHIRPQVEASTLLIIFTGSIAMTGVRAVTGSTWASIQLHALYNFTLLAAGVLRYALLGY